MNAKKINLDSETRIATVSYQCTNVGRSTYVHILARPQTKNRNSGFNFDAIYRMFATQRGVKMYFYWL